MDRKYLVSIVFPDGKWDVVEVWCKYKSLVAGEINRLYPSTQIGRIEKHDSQWLGLHIDQEEVDGVYSLLDGNKLIEQFLSEKQAYEMGYLRDTENLKRRWGL